MTRSSIVTLITDFGLQEPYVGQLKGALLSVYRDARIVDLTHAVPLHDIAAASVTLATSYNHFPQGTVHLIVVDPGVGSDRSLLMAQGEGHLFVCPDNGILSLLLDRGNLDKVYQVRYDKPLDCTFHGRDVMAPLAARLAQGTSCQELGQEVEWTECVRIPTRKVVYGDNGLTGEVMRIDHFGNIRTSLRLEDLDKAGGRLLELRVGGVSVRDICRTYRDIPPGKTAMIRDSDGFIEIAANQASAANLLRITIGDEVLCRYTVL
ncbi:MAG: hypothetical protein CSA33_09290 [Desulfobulbus propionicus]|nr:MAG: hypothetical protein CSA33_09290 [Desulfobulbus propionicus]